MLERSWLGRRVTVRRVLYRSADGRARYGDVVGDLTTLRARSALIRTKAGIVEVAVADIAAARLALPSTGDELALEAVAARGWRAEQTGEIGGWLLRAASGFTGRANSVLPLRAPDRPLDDALALARAWYAERGLPLRVQVPFGARRLLDADLAARGWAAGPDVHVLAARLDALAAGPRAGGHGGRRAGEPAGRPPVEPDVRIAGCPADGWLARYRGGAGTSAAARGLLTRHDRAGFASITIDGQIVAIGRGALDDGWLGVTAVEVVPELRRAGLASAIMRGLWRWGFAAGAERTYLQVSSDNAAALALYGRLGYWRHHGYRYRRDCTP